MISLSPKAQRARRTQGYSIVELILGIAIAAMIVVSFSSYYQRALRVSTQTTQRIQSSFLLEEGIGAIKTLRDRSWTTYIRPLSTTTTYYLVWGTNGWTTTTTPQWIEQTFLRSISVTDVFRDAVTDDMVSSGGVYSTSTKKITASVSWRTHSGTTTETIETTISNLFFN